MGAGAGNIRRGLGIALIAMLGVGAAACSDDDSASSSDEVVEVGVGSDAETPAVELADETSDEEPAWARAVPAIVAPRASAQERIAVADLAGSVGIVAPHAARSQSSKSKDPVEAGDYEGTMEIEIAYYNYCQGGGGLEYAGQRKYEMDAEVFVNPPAEDDGVTERSPFNLIIGTEQGVEGTVSVVSSTVATNNQTGGTVLLDFWDIDQRGDDIEGVLTDRGPMSVLNSISTAQLLGPCLPQMGSIVMPDSIAEGAELTGTLSDDDIELHLVGQTYDREVRFRATFEVSRED